MRSDVSIESDADLAKITDFAVNGGFSSRPYGFFAGHYHLDLESSELDNQQLVVIAATKGGVGAWVVQIRDSGTTNHDTSL